MTTLPHSSDIEPTTTVLEQLPPFLPPSLASSLESAIKSKALSLGFDLVGITTAEPSVFAAEYGDWIANGYAGEMEYLARNLDRRLDPRELLPDARSIVVVGMNYYTRGEEGAGNEGTREQGEQENERGREEAERAVFARYARGDDYHDVMTKRLKELLQWIKTEAGTSTEGRVYVDTGPILEREVARRAGLGWFGKNTMLINTRRGSYFFLGEIVTNLALEPDAPSIGGCGTCTRCMDACPTNAFVAPFILDSRRCISYLTIELKGAIPDEFRSAIGASGNRIYGCDICQEVCPFSHRSTPTTEPAFQPREITVKSKVTDLLYLTDEQFRVKFKGSPVKRAKRRGLLRNAAAALASRDDAVAIAALQHALNDSDELVREQAQWSLEAIKNRTSTL